MRVLSLETAHPPGSLALAEADRITAQWTLEPPLKTTASFAEVADQLLKQTGWPATSIQLVATTQGPGSFTGCRIGVTAAKVFAYATGAHVIGVNTLELIAFQSTGNVNLCAAMDAQRGQLFVARFRREDGRLEQLEATSIVHENDWIQSLTAEESVTGPGLRKIIDRIPDAVRVADQSQWRPRADALALLAYEKFKNGVRGNVWQLTPKYYRKSAAEEKAEAASRNS